jgi:arabinogalactan endo-1,4-beta-galactosidase
MKMSEEFPSKYLKAADLQGREVRVTMAHVEREKIGDDNKPVLYFKGKEKGVVLNKTNAGTISDAYGDDSDDWYDQPLILFSVMVDFQGKVGPAIRCRVPTAKDNRQAMPQRQADPISSGPEPQRQTGGVSDNMERLDDEVPF